MGHCGSRGALALAPSAGRDVTGPQSEGWWRDHGSAQPVHPGRRARSVAARQRAEWESRARTAATRAEIRRWSRWETFSFWVMMGAVAAAFAAPVLALATAIWGAFDERAPSGMWTLFGLLGVAAVLMIIGSILGSRAKERRMTALYADGQASEGRLTEVITHPGGGDDQTTYEFLITAELPGPAVLHRRLYWGEDDGWPPPERWTGRRIRFRHNTLDPDDLYDVRFDGWGNKRPGDRR